MKRCYHCGQEKKPQTPKHPTMSDVRTAERKLKKAKRQRFAAWTILPFGLFCAYLTVIFGHWPAFILVVPLCILGISAILDSPFVEDYERRLDKIREDYTEEMLA